MPFTPFHLGPSSWIDLILFKFFNFPTFLLANVIVDIESLTVMFLGLRYTLQGFVHSFVGGSIIAMLTALAMYYLRNVVRKFTTIVRLEQDSTFKKTLWASFLGVHFHIFLDGPVYTDIQPVYPIASNLRL
ncbi:hydrolase [Candidatus Bathyarchaeota archaeon]|nr:hydrolase [Candidatus Bathyarchaeota archaeon]